MMKYTVQYLRGMREEVGLSQLQLSEISKVHINTINRLENERCDCRTRTLDRILNALGYEVEMVKIK